MPNKTNNNKWKPSPVNTLVCTVGTSLFYPNLIRLDPGVQYKKEPPASDSLGLADKAALERYALQGDTEALREILGNIKDTFVNASDWPRLAGQLVLLPPELRLLGAEINSIEAMIRKGFLSENRERLVLLVSDTGDGASIGAVLSHYFVHAKCPIRFNRCDYVTVSGLQDEKPQVFQRDGLTNLVRLLGEQLRKWGSESIAINATGGYKAQIALAVAFGQATRCPVFYKHERFDQIIRFPRIPFTMDLGFVENNLKLWADLVEPATVFSESEMERLLPDNTLVKESVYPMLDRIEEDGKAYFALSALGMVYWEAYQTLNPGITLEPRKVEARRGCKFPQHHYPEGYKEYVEGVYNQFPEFISECHSVPYSGQKGIKITRFYIREDRIIGEYVDRRNFGARFEIMTGAGNALERKWILGKLMDSELKNVILSALFKPLGGLRKQILDIDGTDDKQPGLLIDEWIREKGLHDRISFVFEPEGENCGPSDSNNFRVAAKAEDFIVPGSHAASKDHTSNALLNIFSDVLLPDREKPQPSFFQADVVGTTFPYPTSQRPTPNLAELWKKFEVDFDKIKHNPGINAVLMLFEKHFSGLPYGAFEDTPVSIYQFAKISAALAASIYNFLQDNPKETLNDSDNMYLLIGADVSGVQDFIYTIYSTGALKNLRARSFYLEILTEKVAHEIIDQLRISSANIIYSGGGGFLMLAQNTEKSRKAIAALQADINKWLLDKFETKLYFNIECEEFSGDDLYEPSGGGAEYPFSVVYRMLSEKIEKSKSNKFSDSLEAVLTPKMPTNLSGYCPVCHTDDKRLGDGGKGIKICRFCSNFAKISTRLIGKGEYRFIHERAYDDDADFTIMKSHYKFSKIAAPKGKSFVINSWDVNDWVNGDEWQLLIGNYSSGCDELEQLAKKSDGKNLIGALRMDVDNLGMIFITGLSTKSIFRMAELSQRLTLFFKYYINVICKGDIDDVYCVKPSVSKSSRPVDIIYAGGDDLFILGAWDQTAEIAFDIQKAFAKYTGNNPSVTLSGGVTLHKHNYPVYQMAQMS
ncbi:MAG: type III-A CRISPR-associated protein Cas10/Csm1 [Desulfobacteraceae bacterium 4572_187]|nr:MAG: type III-A CRISPR-associated protein Cas10/Csm1 [Desulfobacteraceae bacterium 4572_187]